MNALYAITGFILGLITGYCLRAIKRKQKEEL